MTVTDELVDELIQRILTIRKKLGAEVYRAAVMKASVAVAQTALVEAERRSPSRRRRKGAKIIPFPVGGRKP